ncbi:M13-type metalloendopeptidase [Xanthomonas arboricola]|uniref:M13-type metalloendopeptidase n=1 Tax=Xanthomonas arboricola TaxID=56448 RepID=UPI003CE56C17
MSPGTTLLPGLCAQLARTDPRAAATGLSDPGTHAPGSLRATAVPSNMPSFAQAFACKADDPMARAEKDRLVIW